MKLTKKQVTRAIARYARRHGFYARTVRAVTSLPYAAIAESYLCPACEKHWATGNGNPCSECQKEINEDMAVLNGRFGS